MPGIYEALAIEPMPISAHFVALVNRFRRGIY